MMKKVIVVLVVSLFVVAGGLYAFMFHDTNNLVSHTKDLLRGEIDPEQTAGTPEDRYNTADQYANQLSGRVANVNVTVDRLFVFHNSRDGFMIVRYSFEALDSESRVLCGSWRIISHWKIHKVNDEWQIVGIRENP